ncbi:MAG TPA: hypothetical protein PKC69_00050 [Chitinophagaceae bacterium]|nr:hypothetical protein [Chitinophagaceae bacterium]
MIREMDHIPLRRSCYFLTLQTVDWVDIFVRPVHKQVAVHTLNYFIADKGWKIYAWCLMTNQLHLLICPGATPLAEAEKEYKNFTTQKILEAINTEQPSRRDWMLQRFQSLGTRLKLHKKYHVWQSQSTPLFIDLNDTETLLEKFYFIHNHPVRDRIVDTAVEYKYSSARDYNGMKGLVNTTTLPAIEKELVRADNAEGTFLVKYVRN